LEAVTSHMLASIQILSETTRDLLYEM